MRLERMRRIARGLALVAGLGVALAGPAFCEAHVTFDRATTFQTIHGWEATANLLWEDNLEGYRDEVFDRLLPEAGITRIRLEVYSGSENTDHSFRRFLDGTYDEAEWDRRRYVTVNDDGDPFHINPAGFDFADLDWRVDNFVLPLMDRARRQGVKLDINLAVVAFTDQSAPGSPYIHTDPEEFGEFALAAWLHLRDKYGLVPDMFQPMLEPDRVKEWTPETLARAMGAAARRLRAAGFTPRFVAPSVTNVYHTLDWFDAIEKDPDARDALYELSFHRYWGASLKVLAAIAARATEAGVATSMLEYWGGDATYILLHTDLAVGNVSAWQPRAVMETFVLDPTRPEGHRLVLADDMRYDALYFRNILPGAVRFAAASDAPGVHPLAFRNPDGSETVVLRSSGPQTAILSGLTPGSYRLSLAIDTGSIDLLDPIEVGPDGAATIHIGGKGVAVLTSRRTGHDN